MAPRCEKWRTSRAFSPPLGSYDTVRPANSPASQGPGEVPPLGRVNPSRDCLSNPDSGSQRSKIELKRETSSNSGGLPSRFMMFV